MTPEREGAGRSHVHETLSSMITSPADPQGHRRLIGLVGLTLVTAMSLAACSSHVNAVGDEKTSSAWMESVQDRWAEQPGELGSGAGTNDSSSRLSLGVADGGTPAHVRVSFACQGHGTVSMAVWSKRLVSGAENGKRLASRSIQCGHDEDLYVATSSAWITIGPTSGDSSVSWYAAAYADPLSGSS